MGNQSRWIPCVQWLQLPRIALHFISTRYEVYQKSKDKKRGVYHVSSFFQGSSGSPGILFQYGKKLLVVMHTRGFYINGSNKTSIEQGVLFTEIVLHVQGCIEKARQDPSGQNLLRDIKLSDIFPGVDTWPELMDTEE